jgi:hypothetical protein
VKTEQAECLTLARKKMMIICVAPVEIQHQLVKVLYACVMSVKWAWIWYNAFDNGRRDANNQ